MFFDKMIPLLRNVCSEESSSRVKYSLSIRKGELLDDDWSGTKKNGQRHRQLVTVGRQPVNTQIPERAINCSF
jgi:hypothetical protein